MFKFSKIGIFLEKPNLPVSKPQVDIKEHDKLHYPSKIIVKSAMSRTFDFLVFPKDIGLFSLIFPSGLQQALQRQDLRYYYFLYDLHFLDHQRQLKGSYKTGPICPSIRPFVHPTVYLGTRVLRLSTQSGKSGNL